MVEQLEIVMDGVPPIIWREQAKHSRLAIYTHDILPNFITSRYLRDKAR